MYSGKWLGSYSGNWLGQIGEAPPGFAFGIAQFTFQATGALTEYAQSWLPISPIYASADIDNLFDAAYLDAGYFAFDVANFYSTKTIDNSFSQSNIDPAIGIYSISTAYGTIDLDFSYTTKQIEPGYNTWQLN